MSLRVMGHCHLFPGGLGEEKRDAFGIPGTGEHLARFIKTCGFDRAQALSPYDPPAATIANALAPPDREGLDWLLDQPHVGTDTNSPIIPAATIAPDHRRAVERLHTAMSRGVRFLKIHPLINRSNTLAPECDPFYELAAKPHLSAVYHTGGPHWDWPDLCSRPDACAKIAEWFGGFRILLAHCNTFRDPHGFDAAVDACEKSPDLYLDVTCALLPIGRDRWKAAIDRVGPERVIYGNDYPWCSTESVGEELAFIDSLGLTKAEAEGVLGGNLMELHAAARPA